MICEPHWTSYISPFLVPVIACIAVFIAFRQWKTAQNKLKLALFDKRLVIYHSTTSLVNSVRGIGKASDEELWKFKRGAREAKWLLSEEISEYLDKEIYHKVLELQTLKDELDGVPAGDERTENAGEQRKLKDWLVAQFSIIDSYFKPFLKISH